MGQHAAQRHAVYFAAPLFSQAERQWNRDVAERLGQLLGCSVLLPQDFAVGEHPDDRRHFATLFRQCIEGVEQCHALVAILDGPDADSGTAFEMGYAHALGKPMVGVRTDFRELQEHGANLMLARSCACVVHLPAFAADTAAVATAICERLRPLMAIR